MSNHLALNEGEQPEREQIERKKPVERSSTVKPRRVRVARYVSNILSPAAISLPTVILVALYHAQNPRVALLDAFIILVFLSLGPLLYILFGVKTGKLSDMDVSIRSQRVGPFFFTIISEIAGLIMLIELQGPKDLATLLIATAISTTLLMIITLWWKISIHASSLSGAVTMLTVLYGPFMLAGFILVAFVSWSRVVLRRHTVPQVIAGTVLSIVLCIIIVAIRGIE